MHYRLLPRPQAQPASQYVWRSLSAVIIAILTVSAMLPGPVAHADQGLPPYAWYAVAWQTPADTLHWISALGEVASIQRPTLPNEAQSGQPQVAISPDGQYAVIAAPLANQREGIGIYDLAAGQFVQTHEAQPGETIVLGAPHIFNRTSTRVAVGFRSGDYQNPAWRVIAFDLASGNAEAVLDHTHPNIAEDQLSTPFVRYYGVFEGQAEEVVHFQLIPYGVGGSMSWPAYAWLPTPAPANAGNAVTPSSYTHAESDIRFLAGEEVFAHENPNYGVLPPQGPAPSFNAIGRQMPGAPSATTIWVDGTAYNFRARWAANAQGVLYWTDNGQGMQNWNTIEANGTPVNNTRTVLAPTITDAVGTPDGFLMQSDSNTIYHSTNLQDATGSQVFQGDANQTLRIIYVTPPNVQFTLTTLGDGDNVAVDGPGDVAAPSETCPGAPPQRLTVGEGARVTFTNGQPLNLRTQPGGDLVTQIAEGTAATVLDGPQCLDGYSWWQISVVDGAAVAGWAAEGEPGSYYLEPWQGGVGPANAADGIAVMPTATPLQVQVAPIAPTATPLQVQVAPIAPTATPIAVPGDVQAGQDCNLAPSPQLQVGMSVIAAPSDGTYALRYNVNDPTPQQQVLPGTQGTVVGGPTCKNGYRLWQFQFNLNNQLVTGWVSEGTMSKYFVIPWS